MLDNLKVKDKAMRDDKKIIILFNMTAGPYFFCIMFYCCVFGNVLVFETSEL